jgi:hypothetical protein
VLVLLPSDALIQVRDRLVDVLRPGGDLVIENQTDSSPGALAGSSVKQRFLEHRDLILVRHQQVDDYDISVFRRI